MLYMIPQERFWIGTTRFDNKTFKENVDWRNITGKVVFMVLINICHTSFSITTKCFNLCLEMNNEINKIMGIGLIRNKINHDHKALII